MRKSIGVLLILAVCFTMAMFAGCVSKNSSSDSYTIEQFQDEMKLKKYDFSVQDVKLSIIKGESKRMTMADKTVIDIYVFNSKEEMEKEAKCLDSKGNSYTADSAVTMIDWVSEPHFYKKGTILVQYIGENKKIQSDLKDILGEQFAGYKE